MTWNTPASPLHEADSKLLGLLIKYLQAHGYEFDPERFKKSFNEKKLYASIKETILEFAREHPQEVFSGFAIAENALSFCLEKEDFDDEYRSWKYDSFAELGSEDGFNDYLYQEHYNEPTPDTVYARTMARLLKRLEKEEVFAALRITDNFRTMQCDHIY